MALYQIAKRPALHNAAMALCEKNLKYPWRVDMLMAESVLKFSKMPPDSKEIKNAVQILYSQGIQGCPILMKYPRALSGSPQTIANIGGEESLTGHFKALRAYGFNNEENIIANSLAGCRHINGLKEDLGLFFKSIDRLLSDLLEDFPEVYAMAEYRDFSKFHMLKLYDIILRFKAEDAKNISHKLKQMESLDCLAPDNILNLLRGIQDICGPQPLEALGAADVLLQEIYLIADDITLSTLKAVKAELKDDHSGERFRDVLLAVPNIVMGIPDRLNISAPDITMILIKALRKNGYLPA